MQHSQQERNALSIRQLEQVIEAVCHFRECVNVSLPDEAEALFFVDRVEEDRRHGVHGETLDLGRQPEPLDGGATSDVGDGVGTRNDDGGHRRARSDARS
jgi:hypothetical protein